MAALWALWTVRFLEPPITGFPFTTAGHCHIDISISLKESLAVTTEQVKNQDAGNRALKCPLWSVIAYGGEVCEKGQKTSYCSLVAPSTQKTAVSRTNRRRVMKEQAVWQKQQTEEMSKGSIRHIPKLIQGAGLTD